MIIKDLQTGSTHEYGTNQHDALVVSEDGRRLTYYNLQNGDGSRFGDYRFAADYEHYWNIGGMPTIEPEQPIHCQDCKHWNRIDGRFGTCEMERWEEGGRYKVHNEEYEDDFCSHAERRDQ